MKQKPTVKTITIKSDETNPQPVEIIARAVIDVAGAFKVITTGRLSRRAIVLLIKDKCSDRVRIGAIEEILNIVPRLAEFYVKDLPKPEEK